LLQAFCRNLLAATAGSIFPKSTMPHKIYTQEEPLPLARHWLVFCENHRAGHKKILTHKAASFRYRLGAKRSLLKLLHKNNVRDHAPHASQKHIFIKNIKSDENLLEKKMLNDTPRWPPKAIVWGKWLWRESGLNLGGEFIGNLKGNKGKVTPFQ